MEVRLLGPVRIQDVPEPIELPRGKPRAVLAMLALARGRAVSVDSLQAGIWGDAVDSDNVGALRVHVSRLRSALVPTGATVTFAAGGYRLALPPSARVDVEQFERLTEVGLAQLAGGDATRAARTLAQALATWEGDALADVGDAPFAAEEVARLERRRRAATLGRLEAELAQGLGPTLVDELRSLVADDPLDESLHCLLATALYRAGDQRGALSTLRSVRRRLGDELGLDPSPALRDLEQRILQHAASLTVEPSTMPSGNLPAEISSFVGRVEEVATLTRIIGRNRLTTVTGAGGMGKTRLALRVAAAERSSFTDGVWLAELAPVADPRLLAATITRAVNPLARSVGDLDALVELLSGRHLLLVLDNCEQLIGACAELTAEVLRRCPDARILATSREPLLLDGEALYRIPPLQLAPDSRDVTEIRQSDAVQLFSERASLHRHDFTLTDEQCFVANDLCRQLDGSPLAIEMATAQLGSMSLSTLAARLDDQLPGLAKRARGVAARHQDLAHVIDWSYRMLTPAQQQLLCRLAVFSGGWGAGAVEPVVGGELDDPRGLVGVLVDKSLVEYQPATDRFRLLEAIRQYARRAAIRSGVDWTTLRSRHAAHFLGLAEEAYRVLASGGGDQHRSLATLTAETDNLRAAGRALLDGVGQPQDPLRLAIALRLFWGSRGQFAEGVEFTDAALSACDPAQTPALYARALVTAGDLLSNAGEEMTRATALGEHALALAGSSGDESAVVMAQIVLGAIEARTDRFQAAALRLEGLDSAALDEDVRDWLRVTYGYVYIGAGQIERAREVLTASYAHYERTGNDRLSAAVAVNLAALDLADGAVAEAMPVLERAKELCQRLGDRNLLSFVNANLGLAALVIGDFVTAATCFQDVLSADVRSLEPSVLHAGVLGLAQCVSDHTDLAVAARLHGYIDALIDHNEARLDQTERQLRDAHRQRTRQLLGGAAFDAAAAAGRRLDVEQAVTLARSIPSPAPGWRGS